MTLDLVNLSETAVAKDGNVFAVTRRDGSLPVDGAHPLGLYMDDCRFLSGHQLTLGDVRPTLLVTSTPSGPEIIHELTNPPMDLPDGRRLPLQTIRVRLERRLDAAGGVDERIAVHSYAREPVELELVLRLAADFAPMLSVRGIVDPPDPRAIGAEATGEGLRLHARGRDGVVRSTTVTATPPATGAGPDGLRFALALPAGGDVELRLRFEFAGEDVRLPAEPLALPPIRTGVTLDSELMQRVLDRSLRDLQALRSRLGDLHYFSAGIPWYATLFGRDSLIASMQLLAFSPRLGEETLRLLAGMLGTRHDPVHEEDAGKVLHELRVGEVANAGLTPLARYYGTVDATPLWLCLLCEHADWSGDLGLFRELEPQIEAMLGWIDGPGDSDGDGLLDYMARAPGGLRNQGWKDSDDGVCQEDGRRLEPPIALIEAQAYVARAKRRLARLYALDGRLDVAERLGRECDELAARVERFWVADRRYYSMALDRDGVPSRALASNQGHLLWALAVPPSHAAAVRDALMDERMFSGWGIRTLAAGQPAYNPEGYHLGTVWPHDTAIVAAGLRKYGFDEDFNRIFEGLLDAAANSEAYRLPELFAGFSREELATPVPYPVACQPQAWAAGAIPYLLKSGLGLIPDALAGRLRIRRPSLPRQLNRVEVRNLQVADSTIDLVFERAAGGHVILADASVRGAVVVSLEIAGRRATGP